MWWDQSVCWKFIRKTRLRKPCVRCPKLVLHVEWQAGYLGWFPSSGLGTRCLKRLLHRACQAGTCKPTVPKLEFGNQPKVRNSQRIVKNGGERSEPLFLWFRRLWWRSGFPQMPLCSYVLCVLVFSGNLKINSIGWNKKSDKFTMKSDKFTMKCDKFTMR